MIRKIPETQQGSWDASVPAAYLYEGPDVVLRLYQRTGFAVFQSCKPAKRITEVLQRQFAPHATLGIGVKKAGARDYESYEHFQTRQNI
jgi:hypothetical protein